METEPKKERLILVAGVILCAGLLTGHWWSGLSRNLSANRDLKVALISGNATMVFIYHSFAKTVTAVNLSRTRFKNNGSNYQKACAALALVSGAAPIPRNDVFYLVTDKPTADLSAFYETLNSWRSRPGLVFNAVRWLWLLKKEERTNISCHDLLLAVLELSRLNSSNFNIEDSECVTGQNQDGNSSGESGGKSNIEAVSVPAAVIRVEVLNASGKKDLAMQVTKYLRKQGFDVINFGTYTGTGTLTKIVNCSGNIDAAKAVRSALGLGAFEIYSKPEVGNVVGVSVVLGVDFNEAIIKN
jgi:hypothetical protein